MLHYQNVNEVSEATGDQTSEIPLTENHHGIGQNFMLPVRLPVLGLHGKKMPSFRKHKLSQNPAKTVRGCPECTYSHFGQFQTRH